MKKTTLKRPSLTRIKDEKLEYDINREAAKIAVIMNILKTVSMNIL